MRNKKRKNYAQYFGNFMTSEWSWITHFWDMEGGEKLRFRAKGLCKEMNGWDVLGFYSCPIGLPKFLLSKPVPGSKIERGEEARKKARWFELWLTCDNFLLHRLHELSYSCPLLLYDDRNIAARVRLLPVDFYRYFSFHHAIQFHPVECIATRSMPHCRRLANVEAIPFSTSKYFQSIDKFSVSS